MKERLELIGGAEGGRTPDLRIANAALCQTELLPHTRERSLGSTADRCQVGVDMSDKLQFTVRLRSAGLASETNLLARRARLNSLS